MLHDNTEKRLLQAQLEKDKADFFARGGKIEHIPPDVFGIDLQTGAPVNRLKAHKAKMKRLQKTGNAAQAANARFRRGFHHQDLIQKAAR